MSMTGAVNLSADDIKLYKAQEELMREQAEAQRASTKLQLEQLKFSIENSIPKGVAIRQQCLQLAVQAVGASVTGADQGALTDVHNAVLLLAYEMEQFITSGEKRKKLEQP